jgi:hypothetical protein
MTKRFQAAKNITRLGAVLEHVRQHDEIKLPALNRGNPCDTLHRRYIRNFVDEALAPKTIGNELPAITTIVQHRRERLRSVAEQLCFARFCFRETISTGSLPIPSLTSREYQNS